MKNNVERFKEITDKMISLYEEKNNNYGNSFDKSLDEDGLLVSKIRLGDKYNRFSTLIKNKSKGTTEESIIDTLIDLANYSIMTLLWIEKNLMYEDNLLTEEGEEGEESCSQELFET